MRIRRPLIVVGGELRMEQLEITNNPTTGILEAAVQLKSNGGALVIDDFGRQRCGITELLNRWIVPWRKATTINLAGQQFKCRSTNSSCSRRTCRRKSWLTRFLRRIPYKIELADPAAREFRELVQLWCGRLGVEFQNDAVEHLLAKHYKAGRPLRYCHRATWCSRCWPSVNSMICRPC